MALELITDRTQADVDRVKQLLNKGWAAMTDSERAEWNAGMKGAYNYIDLNRVERAVETLAKSFGATETTETGTLLITSDGYNLLTSDGYVLYAKGGNYSFTTGIELTIKTDWTAQDVPRKSDMERYLSNINALRELRSLPPSTPPTPDSMAGLTYDKANDIERILLDIETMISTWQYSGELYCGEG